MSENTIYLITGANRGIGRGLVGSLLARPSTTVIAAVRDLSSPTSKSLSTLPKSSSSALILTKIDSASETDAATSVQELISTHSIQRLDVVIANSGIYGSSRKALEIPVSEMKEMFAVNTIGPLVLFQATHALLKKSTKPKFVVISSAMGSLEIAPQIQADITGYGSSKAAVNYVVRKIHQENEGLIAFPIHPGWVQTDMGNGAAKFAGMEKAPVKLETSVKGLLQEIDEAERGESAKFASFEHVAVPW